MRFPSELSVRLSGPKILIIFAIIAKSVPKKLVTWPKILVTQLFWHILSRLSSRPASDRPGSADFPAGREVKFG